MRGQTAGEVCSSPAFRRLMEERSASPRHLQPDQKVFSERGEALDYGLGSAHLIRRSSVHRRKHKACHSVPKASLVDKFLEAMPTTGEEQFIGEGSFKGKNTGLKSRRCQLEKDVFRLQKRLQQELDLHSALESAITHATGVFPKFPSHLPVHAQELLADIAMLEVAVSNLEEQLIALNLQVRYERRGRQTAECIFGESPRQLKGHLKQKPTSPDFSIEQTENTPIPSPTSFEKRFTWSPATVSTVQQSCLESPVISTAVQPVSPSTPDHVTPSYPTASEDNLRETTPVFLTSPKPLSSCSFSSDEECIMPTNSPVRVSRLEGERIWPQPIPTTPEKESKGGAVTSVKKEKNGGEVAEVVHARLPKTTKGETTNRLLNSGKQSGTSKSSLQKYATGHLQSLDVRHLWRQPNRLSQEMVSCMINIYSHLVDPAEAASKPLAFGNIPSPNSPFGHGTTSSLSSLSESSLLSFTRSPPVDLRNKEEMGTESSFDPYRTRDKLPWADIGKYNSAIEVSWMSVGKEQLEYAAEALRMFRSLVEQLSKVDPVSMRHEEKLAFWINVYNALMMHAYLAYGVPRSDLKFFSLMQKAAYTVGGHSFNAVTIEHVLLKGKAPGYRPQIALLLALHKVKLPEEVNKFAINRVEPLITFALSCGACSSPAVRIYTAENVYAELQAALHDHVRASVGISIKGKLLVPKLVHTFARDLVEEGAILDWICQFLPWSQASIVQDCLQQRRHRFLSSRNFAVVPFDFRFRYLFLLEDSQTTDRLKQ